MNVKHFNTTTIGCFSILLSLSLLCLFITIYWSVTIIPLLNEIPNKSALVAFTELSPQNLNKVVHSKYITNEGVSSTFNDEEEIRNAGHEIGKRKDAITRLCQQYHLGKYKWSNNSNDLNLKEPPTPLYSYFFWNRDKQVAWCPVYKAGSTSWLKNMMKLAGFDEKTVENPPKQLSIWAREVYGDSDNLNGEAWQKSIKLLVVRHPFERLLSAYRDKLANSSNGHQHGTHHFYRKYGKRIVQKFRNDPTITQIEPTWEEFVRYILKTDLIQYADDHWLPAYYSCTPCLVEYDIIAKTETYSRDQKYIIRKTGLEKILRPRWSHSTTNSNNDIPKRFDFAKRYFSQLTKSQVQQLHVKYKLDFLLFGYSPEKYVEFAKDDI